MAVCTIKINERTKAGKFLVWEQNDTELQLLFLYPGIQR